MKVISNYLKQNDVAKSHAELFFIYSIILRLSAVFNYKLRLVREIVSGFKI